MAQHLQVHPRRPRPTPRLVDAAELVEADGFIPPDFDATALESGTGWQVPTNECAEPAQSCQLSPFAATFEPDETYRR